MEPFARGVHLTTPPLCRAIVADLRLYNEAALRQGGDISDSVEEGRALFRSRAAEQLYPLFEDALCDPELGGVLARYARTEMPSGSAGASPSLSPEASQVPSPFFDAQEVPRKRASGLVVALLMAWVVIGIWFALR